MKLFHWIRDNKVFFTILVLVTLLWSLLIVMTEISLHSTRGNLIQIESEREQEHYEKVLLDILRKLEVIETFTETVGVDNLTQQKFDDFAARTDFSDIGFVSFSIAPNGIMAYYYSETYGDDLIGIDLVNDERDHVRQAVAYAIENKVVVINGPFLLLQGGNGLVFRQAIFEDDTFAAIINLVVNYEMLNVLFEETDSNVVDIGVYQTDNTLIFGDLAYSDDLMALEAIDIPNVDWRIGITVSESYKTRTLWADILFVSLSSFIYLAGIFFAIKIYSRNKELKAIQEHMIHFDKLTNLPNRRSLQRDVKDMIKRNQSFFLGFGDLDNFKTLNDIMGHSVGDDYLMIVAERFRTLCDNKFFVYRWGGDEFIILIKTDQKEVALTYIESLYDKFSMPIKVNEFEHNVSISIGFVNYPRHGITIDDLIKRADIVMYDVKSQSKNAYSFFENRYLDNLQREVDFEKKIDKYSIDDYTIYLQPIVDAKNGGIYGFEALSRLMDEHGRMINIIDVIRVLERQGKIPQLDRHVFTQLCAYSIQLKKKFNQDFHFSFNVSPLTLSKEFVGFLKSEVKRFNINPHNFIFEIIETIGFKDIDESIQLLQQLKDLGFQIAMDDFGMGYSSLSYITKLPLSVIKIDRHFISHYRESEVDKLLIYAIRDIAKSLHLKLYVEGIETDKQLAFIKTIGAHYYQGYYHSRPMSFDQLVKHLDEGF